MQMEGNESADRKRFAIEEQEQFFKGPRSVKKHSHFLSHTETVRLDTNVIASFQTHHLFVTLRVIMPPTSSSPIHD